MHCCSVGQDNCLVAQHSHYLLSHAGRGCKILWWVCLFVCLSVCSQQQYCILLSLKTVLLCNVTQQLTWAFGARPQSHCSPSSTMPFPHCALRYVSGTLSRQMPIPWDSDSVSCVLEHSDHDDPLQCNRHLLYLLKQVLLKVIWEELVAPRRTKRVANYWDRTALACCRHSKRV